MPAPLRAEALKIGTIEPANRAFLAPMSGVSDLPFRRLAARYGAGLVVSEMVACSQLASREEEARLKAEGQGLETHVVQLCGRDPDAMATGVRVAEAAGAQIVDINMGCPARRVTTGEAGSALMREPDLALRIIGAALGAASVPVTLKMRLGWDELSINAPEIAARAEAAGIAMISVHGRTRCQFYKGRADWGAVRAVKGAVTVPVVINGDITGPDEAGAALSASGADAVMVGRGSYGRPWIVGQVGDVLAGRRPREAPAGVHLRDLILEHYEAILSHYGRMPGLRIARKHLAWYLGGQGGIAVPARLRSDIVTSNDPRQVIALLARAFESEPLACAA